MPSPAAPDAPPAKKARTQVEGRTTPPILEDVLINPCSEAFKCVICFGIFEDPVFIPCGHSFCRVCLESYTKTTKSQNRQPSCPSCRSEINGPQVKNYALQKVVDELPVKCPNKACQKTTTAGELGIHLKMECFYGDDKCNECDNVCKRDALGRPMNAHSNTTLCEHRKVVCEYCGEVVNKQAILHHLFSKCTGEMVTCVEPSCGWTGRRFESYPHQQQCVFARCHPLLHLQRIRTKCLEQGDKMLPGVVFSNHMAICNAGCRKDYTDLCSSLLQNQQNRITRLMKEQGLVPTPVIQVYIQVQDKPALSSHLTPDDTVDSVKERIFVQSGVRVHELFWQGKELKEEHQLKEIQQSDTIRCRVYCGIDRADERLFNTASTRSMLPNGPIAPWMTLRLQACLTRTRKPVPVVLKVVHPRDTFAVVKGMIIHALQLPNPGEASAAIVWGHPSDLDKESVVAASQQWTSFPLCARSVCTIQPRMDRPAVQVWKQRWEEVSNCDRWVGWNVCIYVIGCG